MSDGGTPKKPRACGALIRDGKILMVKHAGGDGSYWTLPGGHVETGESYEAAAVREVQEETRLAVAVERLLWEGEAGLFYEKCFLLGEAEKKTATLGKDPELGDDAQILKEVSWFQLKEMANDVQISRVIAVMRLKL